MTNALPTTRRRRRMDLEGPETLSAAALEALIELGRMILNLILKLFGLSIVGARKVAGALGLGASRSSGHNAAAEQAHRKQEFELSSPSPQATSAASKSPIRLVPLMKAYLQAPTDHQRSEIADRLGNPQVLGYLEGLDPAERDVFLKASASALRRHFDGKLAHAKLPPWSEDFEYRIVDQPRKTQKSSVALVPRARREPLRSSAKALSGPAPRGELQARTAKLMERRRQLGL